MCGAIIGIFLVLARKLLSSFFEAISTVSDQEAMIKKYGEWFDYNMNPRAQIFKRDQGKVVDLPSMMKLMRLVCQFSNYNKRSRRGNYY